MKKNFGILLFCCVAVTLSMTSCSMLSRRAKKQYHIPEKATAELQYVFAVQYLQDRSRIHTRQRKELYDSVIDAFSAVIDRFPEDQIFTPLARMDIADRYFELKDFGYAMQLYKEAQSDYAMNDFVQAKTLLKIGLCYEIKGKNAKAIEQYKMCVDFYGNHADDAIKKVVDQARALTERVIPLS